MNTSSYIVCISNQLNLPTPIFAPVEPTETTPPPTEVPTEVPTERQPTAAPTNSFPTVPVIVIELYAIAPGLTDPSVIEDRSTLAAYEVLFGTDGASDVILSMVQTRRSSRISMYCGFYDN
ncbi:MAG: hypothetical protein ACI8RD_004864 [Bacillariaceae sp.]